MIFRFLRPFAIVITLAIASNVYASDKIANKTVLVSIAPLHSIVTAITQGVLVPELLMSADISPHDFQLKPSQRRKIQQANLFIWIGDSLETVLDDTVHLEGLQLFGIEQYGQQLNLLPIREDELFGQESHDEHDHGDADYDPHFWMSPGNALQFASALSQYLMEWDAANAATYQHNYIEFREQINDRISVWKNDMAPLKGEKILSAHDGFQYFENEYGFQHIASVQTHTEVSLSIKRLDTLNDVIQDQQVSCLFTEPQVPDRMIKALVKRNELKLATLDIIGRNLLPGSDLYFTLMDNNIQSLNDCYQPIK